MTDVETVARAMIAPLGHNPAADWSRVFVGNGAEADGSLRALCYDLANAALAAATPLIEARVREAVASALEVNWGLDKVRFMCGQTVMKDDDGGEYFFSALKLEQALQTRIAAIRKGRP